LFAQSKEPKVLLEAVNSKFSRVKDYSADIKIKVDIDLFKVPETTAKIYFKRPDKVKMESKGFAMLPKQGMNFSPNKLLSENYEAVFIRKETMDGVSLDVIKVIPLSDTSDVLLSTIWIDSKNNVIRKISSVTKKSGELNIQMKYDEYSVKYGLPSQVQFFFNEENLPATPQNKNPKEENQKIMQKKLQGNVTVFYTNYKINNGLSDEIFKKDKQN
jgi:outer membrane lipoprotein-sorting protein